MALMMFLNRFNKPNTMHGGHAGAPGDEALARASLSLVLGRILSIVVGLLSIPILLSGLGTEGFAVWALLLGGGVAFSTLELGMFPTVMKQASLDSSLPAVVKQARLNAVVTNARLLLMVAFGLVAVPLLILLWQMDWSRGAWLSGHASQWLIMAVFVAVFLSAWLRVGVAALLVQGRLQAMTKLTIWQSVLPNVCMWVVVAVQPSVMTVVLVYWCSLLVVTLGLLWRFSPALVGLFDQRRLRWSRMRMLLRHGLSVQFGELSYFVQFHLDKFLLAWLVGMPAVAQYEIASRGVQAMRSLPLAAMPPFLATLSTLDQHSKTLQTTYWQMMRLVLMLASAVIVVPLIFAPLWLPYWVGSDWPAEHLIYLFVWLGLGAVGSAMAFPASCVAQATGLLKLEVKTNIVMLVLNVALTVALISYLGALGAALGTTTALCSGAVLYTYRLHREMQWPIRMTLFALRYFIAALSGLVMLAVVVHVSLLQAVVVVESMAFWTVVLGLTLSCITGLLWWALQHTHLRVLWVGWFQSMRFQSKWFQSRTLSMRFFKTWR